MGVTFFEQRSLWFAYSVGGEGKSLVSRVALRADMLRGEEPAFDHLLCLLRKTVFQQGLQELRIAKNKDCSWRERWKFAKAAKAV
jgi:hypothetical protein